MNKIYACADHPITCLNPEYCFLVVHWKAERGKLYVRGEKTMWFASSLCRFFNEEDSIALNKEREAINKFGGG